MRIVPEKQFSEEMLDQVMNRGQTERFSASQTAHQIITNVRDNGDKALLGYTSKFDHVHLDLPQLRVSNKERREAYQRLKDSHVAALKRAAKNIELFHQKQLYREWSVETVVGVTIRQITRPLSSVGIYAPGGLASYPSSLLMCGIPAKVAGVKKRIVCSPPRKGGAVDPALLVAADIAEVTEVYRIGGAQAIAAMAYGTETVPKVDKIVGPGNVLVTTAKLEVSKDVAIDIPAGPSEVLIIADETANASLIASDLLAQAEHDPNAWALLLTPSEDLAAAVSTEVRRQLEALSRTEILKASIPTGGLIVIVKNIEEAVHFANLIAPEHLQIQTRNPQKILRKVQNAGAIFVGDYSPVAFGDYASGSNHILPTGGYARSYSGLSTRDFVKTINVLQCTRQGYLSLKSTAITLAELEGLDGHVASVLIRGGKE
jgi:histidinol dehydrogenase